MHYKIMSVNKKQLQSQLDEVNRIILSVLDNTNLCNLIADNGNLLGSVKTSSMQSKRRDSHHK